MSRLPREVEDWRRFEPAERRALIKIVRERLHLTQAQAGDLTGYGATYISQLELEKTPLVRTAFVKLMGAYYDYERTMPEEVKWCIVSETSIPCVPMT